MGWTLLRSHQREFLLEYGRALKNTPQTFRRIAFRRRTLEEELSEVRGACSGGCAAAAFSLQSGTGSAHIHTSAWH